MSFDSDDDDVAEQAAHFRSAAVMRYRQKPVYARAAGEDTTCGDRPRAFGAQDGITLREHYAGLALQGLLACPLDFDAVTFADKAVTLADSLIARLAM